MRLLWFVSKPSHKDGLDEALLTLNLSDAPRFLRAPEDMIVPPSCACIEMEVDVTDQSVLAMQAARVRTDYLYFSSYRPLLALFDMDSTLIQQEVIDQLATSFGLGNQVAEITECAMRGEMNFAESFTKRLELLRGFEETALASVYKDLTLTAGADVLTSNLSAAGVRTGIVSGGFSYFADRIGEKLGMDFVVSNTLDCINGRVTGKALAPVIDGLKKLETLKCEASKLATPLSNTMAVGDGANDVQMLTASGIGVAYHAKDLVRKEADHCINVHDLSALSYVVKF